MYEVKIADQSVQSVIRRGDGNSVLGTVGVEQVQFTFDKSWDGLAKFAFFKNSVARMEVQFLHTRSAFDNHVHI